MANDNPTHKLKVGDLAKIAGVSPSTVSKVINGPASPTRRDVRSNRCCASMITRARW